MELRQKFLPVSCDRILRINQLTVGTKYPIVSAERVVTHLGHTVMLTLRDAPTSLFRVFLPKRYATVVSDGDIIAIVRAREGLSFIYEGLDIRSSYVLAVE